jgi:hypothetical protein
MGFLGLVRPKAIRIASRVRIEKCAGIMKPRHLQSPEVTAVAWIFISTSLSLQTGFSTSLS